MNISEEWVIIVCGTGDHFQREKIETVLHILLITPYPVTVYKTLQTAS